MPLTLKVISSTVDTSRNASELVSLSLKLQLLQNESIENPVDCIAKPGASSGTVSVSTVQNYIIFLINSGALNPSGGSLYVPVHFAPDVTINEDTGLGLGTSCSSWCAYHYSVNTSKGWVYYGIHPEMSSGGCASGCGSASGFANNCDVASHELAEAITDADQPQIGWINNPNGEIGDICNGLLRSVALMGTSTLFRNSGPTRRTRVWDLRMLVRRVQWELLLDTTTATTTKATATTVKVSSTTKAATTTAASTCSHSVCTVGTALKSGCSACVTALCRADAFCCTTSWDSICTGKVNQYCGAGAF
ncbi:hypothetical protein BDR26DRAFT_916425 [Obelidium mucronatum]|nr:hypothetical protein BDR26DRAFT_916425 [Obelidium mucronatum]